MRVPLLGIETEYGIVREDQENSDPVEESMSLLKRCEMPSVFHAWSYRRERTHQDMRGFSVSHLAQDEEEDEFCAEDRKRSYSYWDMKSDRVLTNGARYYNDHTHPEYGTPECAGLFDLVRHDIAGERIVYECARLRNQDLGSDAVQLFKNNTDYSGHSYGTHDNYLIPRDYDFDVWVQGLVPFLITRQLFAGAGKIGFEGRNNEAFSGLQLAQRSDFIESILSIETMTQRPIVNTRDEPHASAEKYRRLHLILGDANMSGYATALKVGTTRLVLELIAREKLNHSVALSDPVADVKRISRDANVLLRRKAGGSIRAIEIQREYLHLAQSHITEKSEENDWILREWARCLDDLEHDWEKLADRIDWAIKKKLFLQFKESEGITWDDPWLKSLDLEYHNLNPERGLYRGLEQDDQVVKLFAEEDIQCAIHQAPKDTRARIRGQMVESERDNIKNIHWTGIEFNNGDFLDLTHVISAEDVEQVMQTNKEQFAWK
jgi:proteasome accessory factor A